MSFLHVLDSPHTVQSQSGRRIKSPVVEIPCDCNECLRMLGLYSSNDVMDDVTRRCLCCPRWNVNNDDDCIWELSGCIERTETNWQQFNVWTTYPLLNGHIGGVNPSLIKKQDNAPAFPLTAQAPVTIRLYGCEAGYVHTSLVCCRSARTQTDRSNCSPYKAVGSAQAPLAHHTCLVAI